MPAIRAVLFDFAGTLLAPHGALDWVGTVAARMGLALDAQAVKRLAREYATAGLPGGPYPAHVPEPLRAAYEARDLSSEAHERGYVGLLEAVPGPCEGFAAALYREVREPGHWVPYADAREVVAELAGAGVRMGVVSNVGFDLRPILRHHGFGELADSCALSLEVGAVKPDPAIFAAALELVEAAGEQTLMIGDHPEADRGAAALGCATEIIPMEPPGARNELRSVLASYGLVAAGEPVR